MLCISILNKFIHSIVLSTWCVTISIIDYKSHTSYLAFAKMKFLSSTFYLQMNSSHCFKMLPHNVATSMEQIVMIINFKIGH